MLRSRNFAPYFIGNAASASGTWFQNLAASILVYRLTHSPLLLGVLTFSQFVPSLVLAPWAGTLADRHDRRKLLLVTQSTAACLAAALAALTWVGLARESTVIAFAAGLGVVVALSQPAQMALVSSLVPRDQLPEAVALNTATFNVARALGPTLAAGLIVWQGLGAAFAVNACSYLLLVGALLVVRPAPQVRAARPRIREGIATVRGNRGLLLYLVIVGAASAGADPINTESPALAHAFGHTATWAGTIIGAFGVGAVASAFGLAGRLRGRRSALAWTLGAMAVGMVVLAATPWLPLGFLFAAVAGGGYLLSNSSATARLQLGVAEEERGRIMALWSVAFFGVRPLASLVDGALASAFGVRVATIVLATPVIVAAVAVGALQRRGAGSPTVEAVRPAG